MIMATLNLFGREPAGSSIASSFGMASAVVIAGVLAAWVFVKQDASVTPDVMLERETQVAPSTGNVERGRPASNSLLEQAEIAFAAGRIIEPEFDNALNYYRSLLETEPDNKDAMQGVDRVVAYLENQAEGAIFQNDWDAARAYVAVILNVRADDPQAHDLRTRANRLEHIQQLTAKALKQFARGNLVSPKDDNAADSYRAILALDANNSVAAQGMRSIVQRLTANAQSAAFAGDQDKALRFAAAARAIDPDAPGLTDIERTKQVKRSTDEHGAQNDLVAASEALQSDRLMPPAVPNAYDLFNAVLARDPTSAAAQRGVALVREALLDRTASLLAGGSLEEAGALLTQARVAGADPLVLSQLQQEFAYQTRLNDAREGRFSRLYAVSELTVKKQVAPTYPRGAQSKGTQGWVEIEFTVTEEGDVRDARARSSSASIFEGAAISAINRWRFAPVVEDGRPVPVRGVVKFTFRGDNG